jgi:hypothetical protein
VWYRHLGHSSTPAIDTEIVGSVVSQIGDGNNGIGDVRSPAGFEGVEVDLDIERAGQILVRQQAVA